MKRLKNKALALLAVLVPSLAMVLGTGGVAHAYQTQECGNSGSGYCLNDWGGGDYLNDPIKMYYGGYGNEDFFANPLLNMCGHGKVTATCPSLGAAQSEFIGQPLFAIAYGPGGCVASDAYGKAVIGDCPDQNGNNGSDGSIFIESSVGLGVTFASREWTDYYGTGSYLESGGNIGVQANELCTSASCTIWNT